MVAAPLALAGAGMAGVHPTFAASNTGSCVGVVTSQNNAFYPSSGGFNNADHTQITRENGSNFGLGIAAHSVGCMG
jgi:hypothetical protein